MCSTHSFFFFFPSNFQSSFFNKKIKFQNSWNIHERSWIITNWINMQQDCVFYTDWSIRKRRIQRKKGGEGNYGSKLRLNLLSLSLSRFIIWRKGGGGKTDPWNLEASRKQNVRLFVILSKHYAISTCLVSDERTRFAYEQLSFASLSFDKIRLIARLTTNRTRSFLLRVSWSRRSERFRLSRFITIIIEDSTHRKISSFLSLPLCRKT